MEMTLEKKAASEKPGTKPPDISETKLEPKKERKEDPPWVLFFAISTGLAVACLAIFGWSVSSVSLLLAELLVGFAAICSGGLFGFLFGLPRASVRDERDKRPGYVPNTNLETISDWLTKILIGVGLVQLREIGTLLDSVVNITLRSVSQPPPAGTEIVTYSVVITFVLLGFLFGFLWTRIVYTRLQTETDDSLVRLLQRVEDLDQEMADQKSALTDQKNVTEKLATGDITPGKLQPTQADRAIETRSRSEAKTERKELPPEIADKIEKFEKAPSHWYSNPGAKLFPDARSKVNGRKLEASILSAFSSSVVINLRVVETDSSRPLQDRVRFLLHPTFGERVMYAEPRDGIAEVTITTGGWFTVVAIVEEDPVTILSLDLREIPGVPKWFKEA